MTVRDDREFLDRLGAADAACLEAVCEHLRDWLVGFVTPQLPPAVRRKVDSDDLVQEAMISFVLHVREGAYHFDHLAGARHLLAVFALDKLTKAVRDNHAACRDLARETPLDSGGTERGARAAPEPMDGHGDPFALALAADLREHILKDLPPKDHPIIQFRIEGCTTKEIAAKANCS